MLGGSGPKCIGPNNRPRCASSLTGDVRAVRQELDVHARPRHGAGVCNGLNLARDDPHAPGLAGGPRTRAHGLQGRWARAVGAFIEPLLGAIMAHGGSDVGLDRPVHPAWCGPSPLPPLEARAAFPTQTRINIIEGPGLAPATPPMSQPPTALLGPFSRSITAVSRRRPQVRRSRRSSGLALTKAAWPF